MYKMSPKPLIAAENIQTRLNGLAHEISTAFDFDIIVSILTGAYIFTADLSRALAKIQSEPQQKEIAFIKASSYGASTQSSGKVKISGLEKLELQGKRVLLVDDIADTGITLQRVVQEFLQRGAKEVRTCVLLNKQDRRTVSFAADFAGFDIPDSFVVGYGLDYAEQYRTLPDIWTLEEQ